MSLFIRWLNSHFIALIKMIGSLITHNAVFKTDQITTYKQIWKDSSFGMQPIEEWLNHVEYACTEKVKYEGKVYISQVPRNTNHTPGVDEAWWKPWSLHEHGFSLNARKRFASALDNFVGIFESCRALHPQTLLYDHNGKSFSRQPSFCTLTVPEQTGDDYKVKQKMLKRFLDNTRKRTQIKLYIWKAEAQLRGAIHFHIAFDKYLHIDRVKKSWYNILKDYNMTGGVPFEEASRICWMQSFPGGIDTLKFELSGYFATEEVEGDKDHYVYKHDRTKKVRKISGNQWGCSDNLRYSAYEWRDIDNTHAELIKFNPLFTKIVKDSGDREVAEVNVYKQVKISKKKIPGKQTARYVIKNKMEPLIGKQLVLWHYLHAGAIYNTTGRKLYAHEFNELFAGSWLKGKCYTSFMKPVAGSSAIEPDYNSYQYSTGIWWPESKMLEGDIQ